MQMIFCAAHIQVIEEHVLPALRLGKTVLLDRYWWSTIVYGLAAGVEHGILERIVEIEKIAWQEARPHRIILVLREKPFDTQLDSTEWRQLVAAYNELAVKESMTSEVSFIRNDSKLSEAVQQIFESISDL